MTDFIKHHQKPLTKTLGLVLLAVLCVAAFLWIHYQPDILNRDLDIVDIVVEFTEKLIKNL